jgi:hypothetical protein
MPSPDRAVAMRFATFRALTATGDRNGRAQSHDQRRADARPKQILSPID